MHNFKASDPQGTEATSSAPRMNSRLVDFLAEIERISVMLRRFGYIVLIATTAGVGVLFTVLFKAAMVDALGRSPVFLYALASIISVGIALISTGWHEVWRKRGDALFEEISDELQRVIITTNTGAQVSLVSSELMMRARLGLRDFVHASDLPFVPGKFGPAIYAMVNLLVPVLILFSSRIFKI